MSSCLNLYSSGHPKESKYRQREADTLALKIEKNLVPEKNRNLLSGFKSISDHPGYPHRIPAWEVQGGSALLQRGRSIRTFWFYGSLAM